MKIKVLTAVSTADHPGFKKLAYSLNKFEYDALAIVNPNIQWNWGGLKDIYDWCLTDEAKAYTHFIYTDGFDTIALNKLPEIEWFDDIIYSGEKACFPRTEWAEQHSESTRWKFLNHGQFMANIEWFLINYKDVFDLPLTCQEWAMERYLRGIGKIDTDCKIFQSIAFIGEDEFTVEGKEIKNNLTGTKAPLIHGNGRSPMDWVYALA